jgi:protein involved in ribonucleotide reduction
MIVYFSTKSENTKRFVERFDIPNIRIPLNTESDRVIIDKPFVLVTPTYGGGYTKGAVPKQVIRFLNVEQNRKYIKGVISTGNTNFGNAFCLAGSIISEKCNVPNIASIELFGTKEDAQLLTKIIKELTQ